jgi:hypothetical protein
MKNIKRSKWSVLKGQFHEIFQACFFPLVNPIWISDSDTEYHFDFVFKFADNSNLKFDLPLYNTAGVKIKFSANRLFNSGSNTSLIVSEVVYQ